MCWELLLDLPVKVYLSRLKLEEIDGFLAQNELLVVALDFVVHILQLLLLELSDKD